MTHTPARLQLRRRLLIWSAPLSVIALLVVVKLISVVVAGNSAVSAFAEGDGDAVRADAAVLDVANVVEPAKAPFVSGTAAVLDGRLDDADRYFTEALAQTDVARACVVLLNLELVRETQGDNAAAAGDVEQAAERYTSALGIVEQAPPQCFAGNDDPDPERQALREDAANRLAAKLSALSNSPPSVQLPPPPPPVAVPPPPPPPAVTTPDAQVIEPRPLDPAGGDPLDKLQQILQDAAGAAG